MELGVVPRVTGLTMREIPEANATDVRHCAEVLSGRRDGEAPRSLRCDDLGVSFTLLAFLAATIAALALPRSLVRSGT
jgi:hypothetical protein